MSKKYIVDVPFSGKVRVTIHSDEDIRDGRLIDYIFEEGRRECMRNTLERVMSKISCETFNYQFGTFLMRKVRTIQGSSGKRGTLDALLTQALEKSNETT